MEFFWWQAAPVEHSVQIYDDQELLMDALEGFASSGLRAGEAVVIIATWPHRRALAQRLHRRGFDLNQAEAEARYLSLDADAMLNQFMVDGLPDEARFNAWVRQVLARVGGPRRRVRAFGEMLALLWQRGQYDATLRLETLWHEQCQQADLWLFCAYPRQIFGADAASSLEQIRAQHAREFPD